MMVTYYRRVFDDDPVFKALADPARRFLLDLKARPTSKPVFVSSEKVEQSSKECGKCQSS
jgi:hypothetical protein